MGFVYVCASTLVSILAHVCVGWIQSCWPHWISQSWSIESLSFSPQCASVFCPNRHWICLVAPLWHTLFTTFGTIYQASLSFPMINRVKLTSWLYTSLACPSNIAFVIVCISHISLPTETLINFNTFRKASLQWLFYSVTKRKRFVFTHPLKSADDG